MGNKVLAFVLVLFSFLIHEKFPEIQNADLFSQVSIVVAFILFIWDNLFKSLAKVVNAKDVDTALDLAFAEIYEGIDEVLDDIFDYDVELSDEVQLKLRAIFSEIAKEKLEEIVDILKLK